MKRIYILTIITAFAIYGCKKPYEDKAIGDPIYTTENLMKILNGKWVMSSALQLDEKSLTKESIDITDFYTSQAGSHLPNIIINTTDHTYTSDTAGVVANYFGTAGTWALDDPDYPKKIWLINGVDTIILPIGKNLQTIGGGYLEFQQSGFCSGDAVMTFKLKLVKQ